LWKTAVSLQFAATNGRGFTIPHVLIYAGIDEAGYGPVLGPLCVACTAFVVRDHEQTLDGVDPVCDLWKRLNKAVCRKRIDKKRRRIAVDDSKLLKGANDGPQHPLKFLERAVLSFLAAQHGTIPPSLEGRGSGGGSSALQTASAPSDVEVPPTPQPPPSREVGTISCCTDLFARLGVNLHPHDWYTTSTPLPVGQTPDELRIAHARLRKTLEEQSISCEMIRCEAIDPLEFNEQVERMGNKANVNLCAALRLIDGVWQRWPNENPFIAVDHLGGRVRYLQTLMQAYPDAQAQVLAEEETISSYRLTRTMNGGTSTLTLTFRVEAESKHLPVALASMTAKYVRELFMLRLNRHFRGLMPELKPTAGYNEDGRRYLTDIEPLLAGQNIDRRHLVRCV
jgi:ribonuclease HII